MPAMSATSVGILPVGRDPLAPEAERVDVRIERVGALAADLGECPLWDDGRRRLWFMDCRHGRIFSIDPEDADRGIERIDVPPPAGSFAFNDDGRLVVALKESIALVEPRSAAPPRIVARIDDSHPDLRLNDGTAMPDGSFVVGTMHVERGDGEPPLGGLYRLSPAGELRKLDRGFGVCNGPRVSPRNGRFHVCDSAARRIFSYAIDAGGGLSDRRPFVDTATLGSGPDGCCFDDRGGLWTALVRVGALARFDAGGRMTHRIDVPVAHPSALCFGGPGLADLFVTSIRDSGRLRANGALDGAVLRLRGSGFRGQAPSLCRIALP
jgi:L-arabinonolactonase